jgi:hypothetical protein
MRNEEWGQKPVVSGQWPEESRGHPQDCTGMMTGRGLKPTFLGVKMAV